MIGFIRKLSIPAKVVAAFSALTLITLLATLYTFANMTALSHALENTAHTQAVRLAYSETITNLRKQRQAILYLLVASDRDSVATFQEASAAFSKTSAQLSGLVKDEPKLASLTREIVQKADDWQMHYAAKQISLTASYLTVNEARAMEANGEPGALFREIGELEQQFNAAEQSIARAAREQADVAIADVKTANIVANVLIITVAVLAGLFFARQIAAPIRRMTTTMLALADGDNSVEVPGMDFEDEIGHMAGAVNTFKENAIERGRLREEAEAARQREEDAKRERLERERQEKERELAQQQAEMEAREEKSRVITGLITDFDSKIQTSMKQVAGELENLTRISDLLVQTADQTGDQSSAAAASAEESCTNVQTVAAAAEQLGNSVTEIARQMDMSSRQSQETADAATASEGTMTELSESSRAIGEIIALINDIAEQTNLLALNATIEAARAGDAGKGFAVVASEVKNLATQTAQATDQIGRQIGSVQEQTSRATQAMLTIREGIRQIAEMSAGVASAVEEQRAATDEIARNVQEAATGTQDVSIHVAGVAEGAQKTRSASQEVATASSTIHSATDEMRNVTSRFLQTVREQMLAG